MLAQGLKTTWIIATGVLLVLLGFTFFKQGTYDTGDSVLHFLHAKYSWKHPALLLDHWGKPFFTLVASPFAQFGFVGISCFNVLMVFLTWVAVHQLAGDLLPQRSWKSFLVIWGAPEVFLAQYSGLTEPLFAALLAWGILGLVRKKWWWACLALSFLPFVRTEGFLLLPVFALYLLLQSWPSFPSQSAFLPALRKALPYSLCLVVGTVIYSLIGAGYYDDLLWIFHQNPYQTQANYGIGNWGHFPQKYISLLGVPLLGLFYLGVLAGLLAPVLIRKANPNSRWHFLRGGNGAWRLIHACFAVYFGAHMVFWATGTAHSMGLMRVLIALTPLAAWIALRGWRLLETTLNLPNRWSKTISLLITLYLLIFPFSGNNASFKAHEFQQSPDQTQVRELWEIARPKWETEHSPLYICHPSAGWLTGLDPWLDFSSLEGIDPETLAPGTLIIWDNWFGTVEDGYPESYWLERADKFDLVASRQKSVRGKEIKTFLLVRSNKFDPINKVKPELQQR